MGSKQALTRRSDIDSGFINMEAGWKPVIIFLVTWWYIAIGVRNIRKQLISKHLKYKKEEDKTPLFILKL